MAKLKLSDVHKRFLVRELACFATPTEAANALKEEYGIELARQAVEHYDPNKKGGGRALAKHLIALFEETREAFLKEVSTTIPEAHKAVRVRKLARAARAFERKSNYMAMADMLERIAKECGNVHTNRREVTGKDGGPIKYSDVDQMTDEQIRRELAELGYGPMDLMGQSDKEH